VGNLRIGGTGKTPTVLAIAKMLCEQGFHPGIISRGYKGKNNQSDPIEVSPQSNPLEIGDEPCYMAQQLANLSIPIVVHSRRTVSAQALLKSHPEVDVLISDDGLQHYAMKRWPAREGGRDIELVIRDARGEGNGFLLPAGPLREDSQRARDYTLNLGTSKDIGAPYLADAPNFYLETDIAKAYQLANPAHCKPLTDFSSATDLVAAAGLGNPQKFFDVLEASGLKVNPMPLPDHFDFQENPFKNIVASSILITEKDAVKCSQLAEYQQDERIWVVPISVKLPQEFVTLMVDVLHRPQP
jgi:tetraacyldisaccharide 4'-kinase